MEPRNADIYSGEPRDSTNEPQWRQWLESRLFRSQGHTILYAGSGAAAAVWAIWETRSRVGAGGLRIGLSFSLGDLGGGMGSHFGSFQGPDEAGVAVQPRMGSYGRPTRRCALSRLP